MKMHKTLYKRDDIHKLYALRKVGGRRLVSIEDNVDALIRRHENYIKKLSGKLITATRNNTNITSIKELR